MNGDSITDDKILNIRIWATSPDKLLILPCIGHSNRTKCMSVLVNVVFMLWIELFPG